MIRRWIAQRIQRAAVRSGTEDLERFVTSLRGQSDEELGMLVATATVLRINFRAAGYLPDNAIGVGMPLDEEEFSLVQLKYSRLVHSFQKEKMFADAAGGMVWLHTLRAFAYPELRLLGRMMWKELERGFSYALIMFDDIEELKGISLPQEARYSYEFIPPGLEPFDL